MGVFLLSVGMLADLPFVAVNLPAIVSIVLLVLLTNTVINGIILRLLGCGSKKSLYAGSLLAQIGEFSFVLAGVDLRNETFPVGEGCREPASGASRT